MAVQGWARADGEPSRSQATTGYGPVPSSCRSSVGRRGGVTGPAGANQHAGQKARPERARTTDATWARRSRDVAFNTTEKNGPARTPVSVLARTEDNKKTPPHLVDTAGPSLPRASRPLGTAPTETT